MNFPAEALLVPILVARRSPALDATERRRVMMRGLLFASVGVPLAVGAVDAVSQVRTIERRKAAQQLTGGTLTAVVAASPSAGFATTAQGAAADLEKAAAALGQQIDQAEAQMDSATAAAKSITDDVKAQKEAVTAAKALAKAIGECAKEIGLLVPAPPG